MTVTGNLRGERARRYCGPPLMVYNARTVKIVSANRCELRRMSTHDRAVWSPWVVMNSLGKKRTVNTSQTRVRSGVTYGKGQAKAWRTMVVVLRAGGSATKTTTSKATNTATSELDVGREARERHVKCDRSRRV